MSYVTDKFDEAVARLLIEGRVGVLPTDTIYGLSCLALDQPAVEGVRRLKGRDSNKPFIVLISDIKMLDLLSIPEGQAKSIKHYWPGALSVIFEAPQSPSWLHADTMALAVRMPNHSGLVNLITKTGPLISTSVNLQGQPPAKSIKTAQSIFGGKLDFYVDGGELNNPPSTLAKASNGKLKILRQGAVKIDPKEQV